MVALLKSRRIVKEIAITWSLGVTTEMKTEMNRYIHDLYYTI